MHPSPLYHNTPTVTTVKCAPCENQLTSAPQQYIPYNPRDHVLTNTNHMETPCLLAAFRPRLFVRRTRPSPTKSRDFSRQAATSRGIILTPPFSGLVLYIVTQDSLIDSYHNQIRPRCMNRYATASMLAYISGRFECCVMWLWPLPWVLSEACTYVIPCRCDRLITLNLCIFGPSLAKTISMLL